MPPNTGTIPFPGQGRSYSFSQLQQLWIQAGGHPQDAPLMAGIALAESSGNPWAFNNKPPDLSGGLWQINYYGSNAAPRTALWGPQSNLVGDSPQQALENAKAAVYLLYNTDSHLDNWRGDAAYNIYTNAGGGQSGVAAVVKNYGGSPSFETGNTGGFSGVTGYNPNSPIGSAVGSTVGAAEGAYNAGKTVYNAAKSTADFLGQLSNPNLWIRIAEVVGGIMLTGLGLYVTVKDMGMNVGKLPGPAGAAQDAGVEQVRALELQNRQQAAENRSATLGFQAQTAVSRSETQSTEFENRQKAARERYLQQRARTRERRANARASEAGATAASRRAERARAIQMDEVMEMGMFK